MLQGVYVLIIFVCKRAVFDLILNKTRRRGQTASTNRVIHGSTNPVINAMTKKRSNKNNTELESMSGGQTNLTDISG
jgi:hypothetical protein